jgi:PIN domain nuclease of toxin-antitoxin system
VPDVIDASAAIAFLRGEPGGETVRSLLRGSLISAVNWSEILQKAIWFGDSPSETATLLESRGVSVVSATRGDAVLAAQFWERGSSLSLGDRFCLAVAFRLGARAVTAERAWAELDTGAEVFVIR